MGPMPHFPSRTAVSYTHLGWYKVNHEGVTGYLSSEYVSFSISGSAKLGNGKVTGNDVNVRSAASTLSLIHI